MSATFRVFGLALSVLSVASAFHGCVIAPEPRECPPPQPCPLPLRYWPYPGIPFDKFEEPVRPKEAGYPACYFV